MKTVLFALILALMAGAEAILWQRTARLESASADFPLGENMGYMQRYADKLWHAGEAGNWDLARYYHDEIQETVEGIESANVVKDGLEISKNLHATLPPLLQGVGDAISARDTGKFRDRYQGMVAACNACHVANKHPFIRVTAPAGGPAYWNQNFSPAP